MEIDKKFQDLEIGLVSRLRELRQAVQLTKSLDKEILQLKKQIKETEFFDSGCKSGDFIFEKDKQITPEEKNQPGDGQNNQNIENSSVENIIRDKKLDLMRLSDILDTNIQKRDLIFERLVRLVDAHERRIADRLSDINLNLLNNNNRSKDWIPKKEQAISLVSKVRDRVEHLSLQFWDDFELASSLMATREKKSKRDETEHKSLFQNPSENRNEASTLSDEKEGTAELNIELKELTELQCLLRSVLNQDIA